jgi:predicted RNase H-like HicB family nuclease
MLSEYMDKAMQHAHYEQIEDGSVFATIPGFEGLWANAPTQKECEKELRDVLEGWILLGISLHADLPEIDGFKWEQL